MHATCVSLLEQTYRLAFPNGPHSSSRTTAVMPGSSVHVCLPKLGCQVLLGMVTADVPGILKQIAYRSTLCRDMSALQSLTDC